MKIHIVVTGILFVSATLLAGQSPAGESTFVQNCAFCHGRDAGGGEEGNADVAGHPDGEVGHEPPGAVFGDDDDVGAGREVLGVDPGGHAADFLHGAGPGPVEELAAVDRLREEGLRRRILLARVDSLQR